MTVEEIKDWREACRRGELMTQSDAWEAIEALLTICDDNRALINALKSSIEGYDSRITTAVESLVWIMVVCVEEQPADELLVDISREASKALKDIVVTPLRVSAPPRDAVDSRCVVAPLRESA